MTESRLPPAETDIAILGAGPVGMTLHLALAAGGLSSVLIEQRPHAALNSDPSALALSHGACQLLGQLDAWPASAATPIHDIHISQRGGFGRTRLDRRDYQLPALGHVVRYGAIAAALPARCQPAHILDSSRLLAHEAHPEGLTLRLATPQGEHSLRCKLLIHAEGTPPDDPDVEVSDYDQHAVICEVSPRPHRPQASLPPHAYRAWERFTPDGPLALLPLGDQYSVVFTVPPARADALMQLDDAGFLHALRRQFGERLDFADPTPRHRFPLALRLRQTLARDREAWIGNTAQTLHPVSGQGFNLGLRDAWQLATTLLDDGPSPAARPRYVGQRQLDRRGGALFTDGIVRLFSNDQPLLQAARGIGLCALDLLPPLRHFVAKRMIWGARAWP